MGDQPRARSIKTPLIAGASVLALLLALLGALEGEYRPAVPRRKEAARKRREAEQPAYAGGDGRRNDVLELALLDEQ